MELGAAQDEVGERFEGLLREAMVLFPVELDRIRLLDREQPLQDRFNHQAHCVEQEEDGPAFEGSIPRSPVVHGEPERLGR